MVVILIFKKLRIKKNGIPEPSRRLMRLSLAVSDLILSLALIIEVAAGKLTPLTYEAHYLAAELYRLPCAVLLAGWIAALSIIR